MKACFSKTSAAALKIFCFAQERRNPHSPFVFRFCPCPQASGTFLAPVEGGLVLAPQLLSWDSGTITHLSFLPSRWRAC